MTNVTMEKLHGPGQIRLTAFTFLKNPMNFELSPCCECYISFLYIFYKMQRYTVYFWKTSLHVSGVISTHHQEHIQLYLQYLVLVKPLLLPAAIVDELDLVWVWCGNCIDLFWCGCSRNRTRTDQYNSHITLKPVPSHPQLRQVAVAV